MNMKVAAFAAAFACLSSAAWAQDAVLSKLATADLVAGQTVANQCKSCHTFEKDGAKKSGPSLWGIVNRVAGSIEGFAYSDAMKAKHDAGDAWTYAALDAFLLAPRDAVPGTRMYFKGVADETDLSVVRTFGSSWVAD